MELAIDTSSDTINLALSDRGKAVTELTWHSKQNHTVELLPGLISLLNQAKINLHDLSAIFIARGPGSFNGLRVGMSTAKGLALSLNLPIIGIGTLEVEAYPFADTRLPLCPIHDAGRDEIAVALYQQDGEWRCLQEAHITTLEALLNNIQEQTLFCGEIPPAAILQLQQALGKKAIIPEATARQRHASYLSALGWQQFQKGNSDDLATLQPLYLRRPSITQPKPR